MICVLLALIRTPASVDTLTIDRALSLALTNRPQVGVAAAVVSRARGLYRSGRAIPNPTFQFDAYDAAPEHKLYLTQPLNWVLRRGADRATGRAIINRAEADSVQMLAAIGREVRRTFYRALAYHRDLTLSIEQRLMADSLLAIANRRLSAGDISALERDQVAQEAAKARQVESLAREAERVATITLSRAVFAPSSTAWSLTGDLGDGISDPSQLVDATEATPPSLAAAIADSSAAAARLRAARVNQIPAITARGGQERGGAGFTTKSFLGFSIGVPIWSQGREAVAEAAGASAVAAGLAMEARRDAEMIVAEAKVRLTEAGLRARIAVDSLVPQAQRIRAGAVRLFEQGQTGVLPVFEALRSERGITRGSIEALIAFQDARAELLAIAGRWK